MKMSKKNILKGMFGGAVTLAGLLFLIPNSDGKIIQQPSNEEIYETRAREGYNLWSRVLAETDLPKLEYSGNREVKPALPDKIDYVPINKTNLGKILERVRHPCKPTRFAGRIHDNKKIKILMQEGKMITDVEGIATYYTTKTGKKTSTGVNLKDNEYSVAVNERLGYPLPCELELTNLENGRSIEVVAIDHGPYMFNRRGKAIKENGRYVPHTTRIIDGTKKVAMELGYEREGAARIRVRYIRQL